jgi:FKBP-type peptidyl-prolyl cis-trans isomerase
MNKNILLSIVGVLALFALAAYWFMASRSDGSAAMSKTDSSSGVTAQPSGTQGLGVEVLTPGTGDVIAVNGKTISVDYTGMFTDGKVFDSSIPRGEPLTITLGQGQVIRGWDLGIVGMKVGEKRRLTIAPELAYGEAGFPGAIPPNSTLVFEITLKAIK